MEVSHKRKFADMFSGFRPSTRASKEDIHDSMRWQLESSTQPPVPCAFSISFVAFGPCPWPKEMDSKRLAIPSLSANLMTSATGSVPGDKMKMRGVVFTESPKDFAMSKVGGSTNFVPILSEMKVMTALFRQSIRKARIKQSFSREVSFSSHGLGNSSLSASTES